ncbi:chloramphenicol 3-O phosphotransferase [Andreprevotia lacus DSM 23236]|jgi:chloramphenicol 3-O phosphotransferase|uniref:Chloramphenicol 3-O phosphotransferase n=1 Tax=Andreprevotia lacus DSM 23236 TaxID=1121001 RepID=A0A1W1XAZ2_9NEIS|nr:AAA family ATPase [Andreprevotia lacus]SMC21106.1 chloramphenicol 3-O phosphotransferase [Andreprevotia lacus DSM 23236]
MSLPQVIILNGNSSSGKTSLAHALQEKLPEQYLNFSIDSVLYALPPSDLHKMQRGEVIERSGYHWPSLVRGYHYALPGLLQAGLKLIIDNAWCDIEEKRELLTELAGYHQALIGVHCSLEVALAREQQRGDRAAGLAAWEHPRVHERMIYDFEVNSDDSTPAQSADAIAAWLLQQPSLSGAMETLDALNLG